MTILPFKKRLKRALQVSHDSYAQESGYRSPLSFWHVALIQFRLRNVGELHDGQRRRKRRRIFSSHTSLGCHEIIEDELSVVAHGGLTEVRAPCCVRLGASQAQRRDQRCDDFPPNQQRHACTTPGARSRLGSVGVARVDRGETAVERAGDNVDERALPRCGVAADARGAVDGLCERHVEREVLVVAQYDFDVTRRRALERFGEDVELLMVRDEVGVVAARRDARHERALDDEDDNGSSVETRVGSGVIDRVAGTNAFVAASDGE